MQQVYGLTDDEVAKLEKDARRVKNRRDEDADDDDDVDDKVQDDDVDEEASSSSSTSIDGQITGPGGDGDDDDDDNSDVSSNVGRGDALDAPTRRLAVLKCDWDRLTAVDLLCVLRSYTPPGGSVHNVTIYPSDFGIERMNEEELRAPDVFAAVDGAAQAEIDKAKSDKSGFDLEERVEAPRDDAPALNDTAATRAAASAGKHVVQDDSDDERHAAANVGDEDGNDLFDENDSDDESGKSGEFEFEEENDDISDSVDTDASDDSSDLAMKELFEGTVARQRAGGGAADAEGTFDGAKLRRYQRDRLKYFYAIAECDSPATAAAVKRECLNIELEATANVLEMRFVPDDMTFDDREPRESASAVPALYKPARWYTPAVAHTSVTLTWDESDRNRTALTTRQWTLQDLVNEEQFAHLLPDSEDGSEFSSAGDLGALLKAGNNDDDDDEESSEVSSATRAGRLKELRSKARKARIRKRYAALLDGGSGEGGKAGGDDDSSSSDGQEMEITFQSGLSEKTSALLESRDDAKIKAERSWWEVQQEKQQALKSVRHRAKQEALAKGMNDEEMRAYIVAEVQNAKKDAAAVNKRDPFESFEQGFESAPKEFADDEEDREAQPKLSRREARKEARKRERKERRKDRKQSAVDEEAQQRARDELALVMMPSEAEERGGGGSGADEGFSVAGLLAADNKKLKTGRKARDTDHGPVSKYEFDVADKRFAAVLENPAFAIDPNASEFIDTSGMRDVMSKRAERQAEMRDRDAAERQKRRETNKRSRGAGGGAAAAAEAADASTAASTAPSAAAVNMLIAGIKQRSLGADRLKRPQKDRGNNAATTEDDGRPKRPRLLQNKRSEQK